MDRKLTIKELVLANLLYGIAVCLAVTLLIVSIPAPIEHTQPDAEEIQFVKSEDLFKKNMRYVREELGLRR